MTNYEGFSKQDLKDRIDALEKEEADLQEQRWNLLREILVIKKLLEEK